MVRSGETRSLLIVKGEDSMGKKHGGNTVQAVRALAEPIAQSLGLSIWDVAFLKEGATWYLRIFIDKEGGVSLTDCENMSRAIDGPLDERDPIEQSYCLEVCSPGLERELKTRAHFEACMGMPVAVHFFAPLENGEKQAAGTLSAYDADGTVTLSTAQGQLSFNKKACTKITLDDFDEGGQEDE